MIQRKPALVARCVAARDVAKAIQFARSENLLVSVRGGDHSAAGNAMCDGGLAIDLSPMNDVAVDPTARTAWAGGGARWRDFDTATMAHTLATTGGTNSDTGVGGLTLGGGLGWLAGRYAQGMYVNGVLEPDTRSIRAAFRPETLQRLVALKDKYDPQNVFRQNANIRPSA